MISKFFNSLLSKQPAPVQKAPSAGKEYKRFNDAIIIIGQDNPHKSLPVMACNERAVKMIGYPESEIKSLDFRELLPPETKEVINDYIEFSERGRRIDEVLHKIPNFKLMGSRGRNVPVNLRVIRGVSDPTHISYRVVMTDTSLLEVLQQERMKYSALNPKEHLLRDTQQVINHSDAYGYESCFAVLTFFDGGSHIKRVEKMIESSKRNTDIIGPWNESTIIYLMPDTPLNNCKVPLERFRNSLPNDLRQQLMIRYCKLSSTPEPAVQIRDCAEARTGFDL